MINSSDVFVIKGFTVYKFENDEHDVHDLYNLENDVHDLYKFENDVHDLCNLENDVHELFVQDKGDDGEDLVGGYHDGKVS